MCEIEPGLCDDESPRQKRLVRRFLLQDYVLQEAREVRKHVLDYEAVLSWMAVEVVAIAHAAFSHKERLFWHFLVVMHVHNDVVHLQCSTKSNSVVSVTINPSHSKQLHHFSKKTGILTPATVAANMMVVAGPTMFMTGSL